MRVLERFARGFDHSEATHHIERAPVVRSRHTDHITMAESRCPISQRYAGGLGGVAVPPVLECEPPRDLDSGHDPGIEVIPRQSHEPDENGPSVEVAARATPSPPRCSRCRRWI